LHPQLQLGLVGVQANRCSGIGAANAGTANLQPIITLQVFGGDQAQSSALAGRAWSVEGVVSRASIQIAILENMHRHQISWPANCGHKKATSKGGFGWKKRGKTVMRPKTDNKICSQSSHGHQATSCSA
jgi:hypothetical protein